jgi:hypothetical protein
MQLNGNNNKKLFCSSKYILRDFEKSTQNETKLLKVLTFVFWVMHSLVW